MRLVDVLAMCHAGYRVEQKEEQGVVIHGHETDTRARAYHHIQESTVSYIVVNIYFAAACSSLIMSANFSAAAMTMPA